MHIHPQGFMIVHPQPQPQGFMIVQPQPHPQGFMIVHPQPQPQPHPQSGFMIVQPQSGFMVMSTNDMICADVGARTRQRNMNN